MKSLNLTPKRSWLFADLKPNMVAWLGATPDDRRIRADFDTIASAGLGFYVSNGAWRGVLYEGDEGCLYIIDERGERHESVYIVEVEGGLECRDKAKQ
ncbi:hypothetical protein NKH72_21900 [Mesorhizobium sp. M0955]|uniref:hypothetical protein n=1 Tax=Mesorhizobium sp. M0955 TaxID=2957033 RepID=UPI00333DD6EB